jgi:hypothetical protein
MRTDSDPGLRSPLCAILVFGSVFTVAAGLFSDLGTTVSVAGGALLAAANLWALGRVVRSLLSASGSRAAWAMLAVLKFAALVVGCYWLLVAKVVDLLPLALGYGALPLGIVAAQLAAGSAPQREGPTDA